MMKRKYIFLFFLAGISVSAPAQETARGVKKSEQPVASSSSPAEVAVSVASCTADIGVIFPQDVSAREAFEIFARQRGGIVYGTPDARGITYYTAIADVRGEPGNVAFVTARQAAFSVAYDEALKRHRDLATRRGVSVDTDGVNVVKTMESRDAASGHWQVGVILKYDPVLSGALRNAASGVLPVSAVRGLPACAVLAGEEARVIQNFGTRVYYNEKGELSLLAYGQMPVPAEETDPRQLLRQKAAAQRDAGKLAILFLDRFLAEHAIPAKGNDLSTEAHALYGDVLRHPSGVDIAVSVFGWNFSRNAGSPTGGKGTPSSPALPLLDAYDF